MSGKVVITEDPITVVVTDTPDVKITVTEQVTKVTVMDGDANVQIIETAIPAVVVAETQAPNQVTVQTGQVTTLVIDQNITLTELIAATQTYIWNQDAPSSFWVIPHGLNKYPSVTVVDSGGNVVYGDVTYVSTNQITIEFSSGFSGKAYLN